MREQIEPTSDGRGMMPKTTAALLRRQDANQPFDGSDRTGMPRDLAAAETSVFQRFSPRRRWTELKQFDERADALQARQSTITQERDALHRQRANAPAADADRLGAWHLNSEQGARPEPTVPVIVEDIERANADLDGLTRAVAVVLQEKTAHVQKHRDRLVQQADRAVQDAHGRLVGLVAQLEAARGDLAELRAAAVWAAVYPSEAAMRPAQDTLLAGGQAKPLSRLGLTSQVNVDRLWAVLRADADWLATAASPEQRAAMEGRDPRDKGGATWAETPAGHEADRAERQAALQRYRETWGCDPA